MSTTAPPVDLDVLRANWLAAWNGHDPDAIVPLLAPDVTWADPTLAAPVHGVPAAKECMRAAFEAFPDLRFEEPEVPQRTAGGDQVAWAWRMRGTHTGPIEPPGFAPTGRSFEVEGVDLWTLRDGRIARCRALYDMNALVIQLGLAPAPGGRTERAAVALQRLAAWLRGLRAR